MDSARRALAPLDANVPSPLAGPKTTTTSPLRKRAVEAAAVAAESPRPEKRPCTETTTAQDTSRAAADSSSEEDESSLFDQMDKSWASNTTPDVSPAPRTLTREQARQKAERLRLRLGLASYKVRTGQTAVPLADLVVRPVPRRAAAAAAAAAAKPETVRDDGAASGLLSLARGGSE